MDNILEKIVVNERNQKVIRTSFIRGLVYNEYMTKKEINKALELTNAETKLLWAHDDLKDVKDQKMPSILIISDLSEVEVSKVVEEKKIIEQARVQKEAKVESKEMFNDIASDMVKEGEAKLKEDQEDADAAKHEEKLDEAWEADQKKDEFAVEEDRFKAEVEDKGDGMEETINDDEEVEGEENDDELW